MRKILFFLALALPLSALSQTTITLHQRDGQTFSFGFDEKPVMILTDSMMTVKTANTELSYRLSQVAKFTFDDPSADVSQPREASGAGISLDDCTVRISGAKPGATVRLMSVAGSELNTFRADATGCVTFSIADLESGCYIITAGESLTYTILRK